VASSVWDAWRTDFDLTSVRSPAGSLNGLAIASRGIPGFRATAAIGGWTSPRFVCIRFGRDGGRALFERIRRVVSRCLSTAVLSCLAGCASIPTSGPSASAVIDQGSNPSSQDYQFIDLNESVIDILNRQGRESFAAHFVDHRSSAEPLIGIGDGVSVTIWEASAGGLFSAPAISDKFSAGSNSATIPEQIVGRDGAITVPYAGRVEVAGRTTRAVQSVIEQALAGKAIQPQVLVNVLHPISNSVTVGGEAVGGTAPLRVPLSVKGDRLLDVIASVGGIKVPVNETYVELSRGRTTARVPLVRVIADPHENIFMQANDVLTLVRDPQTFLAVGATGINAEIPFNADGITLAQALVKAGGLQDARSDPQGVFIFRYEHPSIARELTPGAQLAVRGPEVPIVYRLDLRNPNSLFVEQKFRMASHDLVYVSNAPLVEAEKIIGIFNSVLSPASQASSVAYDAALVHSY
jgi:polysaccharide export outer membrane protein